MTAVHPAASPGRLGFRVESPFPSDPQFFCNLGPANFIDPTDRVAI